MQSKWVMKEVVAAASMGSPKKGMDTNYTLLNQVFLKSFLYCQGSRRKAIF
jgi:hypothetical protein